MRRFFTTILVALAATTLMAQMQIWYNGSIVYQREYALIDSITFGLPNGGGQGETGDVLSPEDSKEYLMEVGKRLLNMFKTEDQKDLAELAEGAYTKYRDYNWELLGQDFENKYDHVFNFGRNEPSPAGVVPIARILKYTIDVTEGGDVPTGIDYVWTFPQDNFIYEADEVNKRWNNLGKTSDNSVIVRFKDAKGVQCEIKVWGEGKETPYDAYWDEMNYSSYYDETTGRYVENNTPRYRHHIGAVVPEKIHFVFKQGNKVISSLDLQQDLQMNDHAIMSFDVMFADLRWTADMNVTMTHATAAFAFKYQDKPIFSAFCNVPVYELLGKKDTQSWEQFAEMYAEQYDQVLKKVGPADGVVDILGEVQLKAEIEHFGYAYRDWMKWEDTQRTSGYNSREAVNQFCSIFSDNSKNGIYYNSDVKQAEIRVQPKYDEVYNEWEPEGVLYFPQDHTTYAFEEYFNRKPFTNLQYMTEDLLNAFVQLSDSLYNAVGNVDFENMGNEPSNPNTNYPQPSCDDVKGTINGVAYDNTTYKCWTVNYWLRTECTGEEPESESGTEMIWATEYEVLKTWEFWKSAANQTVSAEGFTCRMTGNYTLQQNPDRNEGTCYSSYGQ